VLRKVIVPINRSVVLLRLGLFGRVSEDDLGDLSAAFGDSFTLTVFPLAL
jgi:hypothetical protein